MKYIFIIVLLSVSNYSFAGKCIDLIAKQDYYAAAEVCDAEAKKGDVDAQFGMGTLYYNGNGVIADMSKAYKWMLKASQNGLNQAQYNLGLMLANGQGTEVDLVTGFSWLYIAKENGFADAEGPVKQLGSELSSKEKKQAEVKVQELLDTYFYKKKKKK